MYFSVYDAHQTLRILVVIIITLYEDFITQRFSGEIFNRFHSILKNAK